MKATLRIISKVILSIAIMMACAFVQASEDIEKYDILIDLSNPVSGEMKLDKKGEIRVKIINMVPTQRSSYLIQADQITYLVPEFKDPNFPKFPSSAIAQLQLGTNSVIPNTLGDKCKLNVMLDEFLKVSTSIEVADIAPKIRQAVNSEKNTNCLGVIDKLNFLLSRTQEIATAKIDNDNDAKISVSISSTKTPLVSILVKPVRKEWISSFGFGFVDSQNKNYHSVGNDSDGYIVTEQKNRENLSYSALMVFTYPFKSWSNGLELGVSGGIGATQENVAALAGISLIVNKNFILTGGAIIQEFDVLKGQYSPGDNIGSTPIDSAVFKDKTFKPAAAIVLSYRFSAGGSGSQSK